MTPKPPTCNKRSGWNPETDSIQDLYKVFWFCNEPKGHDHGPKPTPHSWEKDRT